MFPQPTDDELDMKRIHDCTTYEVKDEKRSEIRRCARNFKHCTAITNARFLGDVERVGIQVFCSFKNRDVDFIAPRLARNGVYGMITGGSHLLLEYFGLDKFCPSMLVFYHNDLYNGGFEDVDNRTIVFEIIRLYCTWNGQHHEESRW